MHLPYTQIEDEVFDVSAPELAVRLRVSEADAFYMLARLFRWGRKRCPEGELPSTAPLPRGDLADSLIARACGWKREPEALTAAFASLTEPALERTDDSWRIRGLGRYDKAIQGSATKQERWRRANEKRKRRATTSGLPRGSGAVTALLTAPEPLREIETQTETKKEDLSPPPSADHVAREPDPKPEPVVVKDSLVDELSGAAMWELIQATRAAFKLDRELSRPGNFGAFVSTLVSRGTTEPQLEQALRAYYRDLDFAAKRWPTAVFCAECVYSVRLPPSQREQALLRRVKSQPQHPPERQEP